MNLLLGHVLKSTVMDAGANTSFGICNECRNDHSCRRLGAHNSYGRILVFIGLGSEVLLE